MRLVTTAGRTATSRFRRYSAAAGALIVAGGLAVAVAPKAHAGAVTYLGDDLDDPNWRNPAIVKPLDPDGNNIYGSAGYAVLDSSAGDLISAPIGVTVTRLTANQFPGNSGYVQINSPTGSGMITSGVWYDAVSHGGQTDNFAALTFTQTETYVVGIFTNNTDYANISPSDLRIVQVQGTDAFGDSGWIAANPNREGDWFFFAVQGQAGDVFDISGLATAPGGNPNSDGIGLISFDAVGVPEPSTRVLFAAALALLASARRRPRRVS